MITRIGGLTNGSDFIRWNKDDDEKLRKLKIRNRHFKINYRAWKICHALIWIKTFRVCIVSSIDRALDKRRNIKGECQKPRVTDYFEFVWVVKGMPCFVHNRTFTGFIFRVLTRWRTFTCAAISQAVLDAEFLAYIWLARLKARRFKFSWCLTNLDLLLWWVAHVTCHFDRVLVQYL